MSTGWAGFDSLKADSSKFPDRAYPVEDPHLYKILDEEPFVGFRQHWVMTEHGNRPYTCIKPRGGDIKDCPLCAIGDEPAPVVCFNAVQMDTGADPILKVLQLNISQTNGLQEAAAKQKWIKSIDNPDVYWGIYTTGKSGKKGQGQKQTQFAPIKARDLVEDWDGTEPLTESDEEEFMERRYGPDFVNYPTRKDLRLIAQGMNEDED